MQLSVILLLIFVIIFNSIIYCYFGILEDLWMIRIFFRYTPCIILYYYVVDSYIKALNNKNSYNMKIFKYLIIIYLFCVTSDILANIGYNFTNITHDIFIIFVYLLLGFINMYHIFQNENLNLKIILGLATFIYSIIIISVIILFSFYCDFKNTIFICIYSFFVIFCLFLLTYKILIYKNFEYTLYFVSTLLLMISQYLSFINFYTTYYAVIDIVSINIYWLSLVLLSVATMQLNNDYEYIIFNI